MKKKTQDKDVNILQRPMQATLPTFDEARKAFDNGTDEVRRLLMHECNLIYECNACRNLFRCLSNFISHKRFFCTTAVCTGDKNGFADQPAMIVPKETENIHEKSGKIIGRTSNNAATKETAAQLQSVPTRVVVGAADCPQISGKTHKHKHSPAVLQSERVSSKSRQSTNTLQTHVGNDNEKLQLRETTTLSKITDAAVAVVEDNCEKAVHEKAHQSDLFDSEVQNNNQILNTISCIYCKLAFPTEKTLQSHIDKKHNSASYVYQCPICALTFLQPSQVIRHLSNDHKKSMKRIRLMRDEIMKRRVQLSSTQSKAPNRELKRLQWINEELKVTETVEESTTRKKPVSTCIYCNKTFERRAAFSTHMAHCPSKVAMPQEPKPAKRAKLQDTQQSKNVFSLVENTERSIKLVSQLQEIVRTETLNEMYENLAKQSFGTGLQTISLDAVEIIESDAETEDNKDNKTNCESTDRQEEAKHDGEQTTMSPKECLEDPHRTERTENGDYETATPGDRPRLQVTKRDKHLSCRCKICHKQFSALSNLRRHISMFHYGSEKFGCKLCEYRAFRRYDIVNHLGFAHKMKGEREALAEEYVVVHEVQYSKTDMDDDIMLLPNVEVSVAATLPKVSEKRSARQKAQEASNKLTTATATEETTTDSKASQHKMKRTRNSNTAQSAQKRPIRNRVKPVNKDFVYDLSNMNNANVERENLRSQRRRYTTHSIESSSSGNETLEMFSDFARKEDVKGAVERIALKMVNDGLAASATCPEMPTARRQWRPRLSIADRGGMQAGPIFDTSVLEAARRSSSILEDTFLDKITKASAAEFKIKPCLASEHDALSSRLLQKVDLSRHRQQNQTENENQNIIQNVLLTSTSTTMASEATFSDIQLNSPFELPSPILRPTVINSVFQNNVADAEPALKGLPSSVTNRSYFIEPSSLLSSTLLTPPATKKRLTLMERIGKVSDNLLRSSLQH